MNKLDNLHEREMKIIHFTHSLKGTMENRYKVLDEHSIPQLYNQIFLEYTRIATDPEALKRAIFIQWYAVSEPGAFTGINELDEPSQKLNMDLLCNKIEGKEIDLEFQTMLLHYYQVSDWYFNTFTDFKKYIRIILNWNNRHNYLDLPTMENRGQLGIYWKAIYESI